MAAAVAHGCSRSGVVFGAGDGGLFARQSGHLGDWNYQGGERSTFYCGVPVPDAATPDSTWERRRARDEALTDILFDPRVFWINLVHNLVYYLRGPLLGLVPYFFPAVVRDSSSFLRRPASGRAGSDLVLSAAACSRLCSSSSRLPYTWFGGGGSVGNRYFMGAYGVFLFLLPPIDAIGVALVPWLSAASSRRSWSSTRSPRSFRPGHYAHMVRCGWLPVELTQVNDLPINTDPARVRVCVRRQPGSARSAASRSISSTTTPTSASRTGASGSAAIRAPSS